MQNAAMFSCSHVFFGFLVFSFFETFSFSADFLSFSITIFLHVQGARNPHSPVLANEDQVMWGCKRTC